MSLRDALASDPAPLRAPPAWMNRRARSFYERHGYAHVGDLAGFVRPGIAESLYLKSWRA
jgi:hypothetical protein